MEDYVNPPMIVRSTQDGGFVRCNPSFLAKVGFTEKELGLKPFIDWVENDDRQVFRRAIEGGDENCRVRHTTRDGASVWLDLRIRDQKDSSFVLGRCVESNQAGPSSEENEAEVTVKSTLHKIAEIVEEQNPGFKCSILLVAHGRFVKGAGPSLPDYYNNAIDGYKIGPNVGSCGTAIYWNAPVIVEDTQKDPLWVPFAELAKKAGLASCWSHPFAAKGGRVMGALALYSSEPGSPTDVQLNALRAAAQLTGLAVERGRAEEELRIANKVKDRFMANMSHEIRTPLNALIGTIDFLLDEQEIAQRNEMGLLRESSEQLLELFTGILDLTQARDRRKSIKSIDLPACCRRIHELFEVTAKKKGLQFELALSENVPQWVSIDEWAFERALRLLIHNAVKFSDSGSVRVALDFSDHKLRTRIADSGCGIELERLKELREPFVQGDLSTKKRHSGFGLGLALGDLCLQALGGELKFDANEPRGTVVSFGIPISLASPPVEAGESLTLVNREPTELPLLIVEDNRFNSVVLERILKVAGYKSQLAENGEEALKAMDQDSYSCILMDCQMPVMDGYEATRNIRQLEENTDEHIPIIAVTANALAGDRDLCLEAGMDDYLKKPVRKPKLMAALEKYAGKPSFGANED